MSLYFLLFLIVAWKFVGSWELRVDVPWSLVVVLKGFRQGQIIDSSWFWLSIETTYSWYVEDNIVKIVCHCLLFIHTIDNDVGFWIASNHLPLDFIVRFDYSLNFLNFVHILINKVFDVLLLL